jgi:sugar lactone lactonase YvrE
MRPILLFAAVLCTIVTTASAEPQKLWEAKGFKSPESALYDPSAGVIYVSNANGDLMTKDGNGFISKLAPNGDVLELEWVTGLDSPTGLALAGDVLYVNDWDQIVAIDVASRAVKERYEVPGAKFLNDLASDSKGRVFSSDMVTNSIWMLDGGKISLFVQDDNLDNPNGLHVEEGRILVASWGKMAADFSTKVPGHVKAVDLKTKAVSDLGDPTPVGNLDGIAPDGAGGYHVTDWVKGGLFHVTKNGKAVRVAPLNPHSADLCAGPAGSVIIPMMADGTVLALKVN